MYESYLYAFWNVICPSAEMCPSNGLENINQATISCGLTINLYANPAIIYFTLTLRMFGSSCKAVNSGQWLKELRNKKDGIQFLDIDLEFCGGKYFACLRLARGERGILEVILLQEHCCLFTFYLASDIWTGLTPSVSWTSSHLISVCSHV